MYNKMLKMVERKKLKIVNYASNIEVRYSNIKALFHTFSKEGKQTSLLRKKRLEMIDRNN